MWTSQHSNAGLMMAEHNRRWANIKTALDQRIVHEACGVDYMLGQWWSGIVDDGPILNQQWSNVFFLMKIIDQSPI